MATAHVAEAPQRACVKGGLIFGAAEGLLEDGDLTSLAAAKAAVVEDNALLHVSQRTFGGRVTASLDRIGSYDPTYLTGSDVDKPSMLAVSPDRGGRTVAF